MTLAGILSLIVMGLGFGFVVFWHELGHFLAAKWAGVKVDQFAVGFGRAALCWRKGIGFTVGTSAREYEAKALDAWRKSQHEQTGADPSALPTMTQLDAAARQVGLGETEYRINWIPLGGYVKMLGQDDMDPTSQSPDPRSYNNKTVGQRMVIISAGVVMNVILAGILFTVLFMYGFTVPKATIGTLLPGSPAQAGGLQVGDRIVSIHGHEISDFTKISFNVALLPDSPVEVKYERDGKLLTTNVHPRKSAATMGMLGMGIGPTFALRGADPKDIDLDQFNKLPASQRAIRPGDTITAIAGQPVDDPENYRSLDVAVQSSGGTAVPITVKGVDGTTRQEKLEVRFASLFGAAPLQFAGLAPRAVIEDIQEVSTVKGKLEPGDVLLTIRNRATDKLVTNFSRQEFIEFVAAAGMAGQQLDLTVLREGKVVAVNDVDPSARIDRGRKGLGVAVGNDDEHPVVGQVLKDSPAARAAIPVGAEIVKIGDRAVTSWHDVLAAMKAQAPGKPFAIALRAPDGSPVESALTLGQDELTTLQSFRYAPPELPALDTVMIVRKTANPAQSMWWGVGETRDLILKSYVTLKRMTVDRTVSPSNLMGPIEIFRSGALFAQRGTDWFIWFLAMISANLAVVNFLPIPIVDGGHFAFLLIEKLTGKKPSPAVQAVSAYIGLGLLLSLFLFVTYNDLGRIFMIW